MTENMVEVEKANPEAPQSFASSNSSTRASPTPSSVSLASSLKRPTNTGSIKADCKSLDMLRKKVLEKAVEHKKSLVSEGEMTIHGSPLARCNNAESSCFPSLMSLAFSMESDAFSRMTDDEEDHHHHQKRHSMAGRDLPTTIESISLYRLEKQAAENSEETRT